MAKKNKADEKSNNLVDISKVLELSNFKEQKLTLMDSIEVTIFPLLTLKQTLAFIDNVVDSCFDSESGAYLPELKELAIGLNILMMYTNCRIPDDIEDRYRILYAMNKCQDIIDIIDKNQFYDIMQAIDEAIEHKKNMLTNAAEEKINSVLAALKTADNELSERFKNFEDLDMDAVLKGLLSNGVIDEEKLVNAVKNTQKETLVTHKK